MQQTEPEISLLQLVTVLLNRRRLLYAFGIAGAVLGLVAGLLRPREYVSAVTFIPQAGEGQGPSGLAAAASQLGISVPSMGGSAWGPPVYVELLRSRVILEPIALDTIAVAEMGGRRVPVSVLFDATKGSDAQRTDATVRALRRATTPSEQKTLGAVKLTVNTRWPSVSLAIADRMVENINRFNIERRSSQAGAERKFAEKQVSEREKELQDAERDLRVFLEQNRVVSPRSAAASEQDRLERRVQMLQTRLTSLMMNAEEARMREIRDIPVLTVLESPRLALSAEPRGAAQRAVMGGLAGVTLATLVALTLHAVARVRHSPDPASRDFLLALREVRPPWAKSGQS